MALTATEEALVRQLLDQQAAILSLAGNEATITSKLGATKVTLADLVSASAVADADLFLLRQGTTDKSVTGAIVKALAAQPDASETVKGIVELATAAETVTGTDTTRAVHPAGLASALSGVGAAVEGSFKNLSVSTTGLSANVSVTIDELIVQSAGNAYKTLRNINATIAGTSVGANALDAGTIAASTWYSVWIIWNGTTTAGLLSLSATAPTLPSGYTHKARVGWIRTDGTANKYPLPIKQKGRSVQYTPVAASNLLALPVVVSGTQGAISTPTWVAASVVNFVPSTANRFKGLWNGNSDTGGVIVAPNNAYGGSGASGNGKRPWVNINGAQDTYGGTYTMPFDMLLESTNIYYAASGASNNVQCIGWEDNI